MRREGEGGSESASFLDGLCEAGGGRMQWGYRSSLYMFVCKSFWVVTVVAERMCSAVCVVQQSGVCMGEWRVAL